MIIRQVCLSLLFFFNDTATTEIYTLSLHDALPISVGKPGEENAHSHERKGGWKAEHDADADQREHQERSEEHTSELQSRLHLVCRLLLEKKNTGYALPDMADPAFSADDDQQVISEH